MKPGMEEIRRSSVVVNGEQVETFVTTFNHCNVITVEAGTTGYCGGDTGHGGRTYFSIKDEASTDMSCRCTDGKYTRGKVELMFGGDSELDTFIAALEFALDTLKRQKAG